MKLILLVLLLLVVAGCASLNNLTHRIHSDPSGAQVYRVHSDPSGEPVYLNGVLVGITPTELSPNCIKELGEVTPGMDGEKLIIVPMLL